MAYADYWWNGTAWVPAKYREELPTLPEAIPSPEPSPAPVAVAVHEFEAGLDIE